MHALKKVLDSVLATACVVLFALLIATVSWQVFTRQVLNAPSSCSEELAKYVFVYLAVPITGLVITACTLHHLVSILRREAPVEADDAAEAVQER